MRADELRDGLAGAGLLVQWPDWAGFPEMTAVVTDSRRVTRGALFAAYRGAASDGHAFALAAAQGGAVAALVEHDVPGLPVPQVVVRDGRLAAGMAAALFYGRPAAALELLAVTGTNGKTTSVALLRHLFGEAAPAASIGTLGAIDGAGNVLPGTGSLTTPGPVELQEALATLRDGGVRTVAMETSSHALDQDRIAGLRFRAALFTNLTRDHLDYHGDEATYLAAKLKLQTYLAADGVAVSNAEDAAWRALAPRPGNLTFGVEVDADVTARDVAGDATGMRFTLGYRKAAFPVALPLLGRFNVENALGAAAVALALGHEPEHVAAQLCAAPQVPGRMERLTTTPCVVLRDYAHTPDALERALAALRPLTRGRLIVVFGAGGDRDRGKRPVMGGIAVRESDLPIVTSDNPRTEDPERILDDIEEGMGDGPHLRIVDRRVAIARALSIARPDDTVLLAGKGHETYQVVGAVRQPMDELAIVQELVAGRPA
jgi:UDP-N-acetylmuramoyl-L-alanyl-D-glutamate--2,6-diaminopimelate ligase